MPAGGANNSRAEEIILQISTAIFQILAIAVTRKGQRLVLDHGWLSEATVVWFWTYTDRLVYIMLTTVNRFRYDFGDSPLPVWGDWPTKESGKMQPERHTVGDRRVARGE